MVRTLFALALLSAFVVNPGALAAQRGVESEIIRLEEGWSKACKDGNRVFLEQLFASEFLFTDAKGATYTKEQEISRTLATDFSGMTFALSDVKVRVYGEVAVVTGLNTVTTAAATAASAFRVTDVFVKRDGRWQIVVAQGTRKL